MKNGVKKAVKQGHKLDQMLLLRGLSAGARPS